MATQQKDPQGSNARRRELLRRSTHHMYGLLATLGEKLYLEAMCLCDDEKDAAAWASAILIHSLEERGLLARFERCP